MPGMNGIEFTYHLKRLGKSESIFIMISSVEWSNIAKKAKAAGIKQFLPKPIFPSDIITCINRNLGIDILNENRYKKSGHTDSFWGYRVLLTEDVEINREIVIALLEPTLVEIDCAENGAEAVRMFSESPDLYNMIFMDIQMPVMDGYEATKRIRSLNIEKAETIPIIAMTANVFKDDVKRCIESGMNDHLGKPLDFEAILQILREYLFRQKPVKERRKGDRRKNVIDRRQLQERRIGERRSIE